MIRIILVFIFVLQTFTGFTQVYTGFGGTIKDDASRNFYNLPLSGLAGAINSKFGVFGVEVNINHSNVSDLNIYIIAPDNSLIELSSGNGGNGKSYTNCLFTNNSNVSIRAGKAPFKGSYKPEGSLGVLNNGQNPNSTWRLAIVDTKPGKDTGRLLSWSIVFSTSPSKLEPFVNSNLPLILINTFGKSISDEPRISSGMRIINNSNSINALVDSSSFFNYGITIEFRGSSSQSFPKKPYGFTTVTKTLADTNVSLLGLPSEHDWVLNATYNDKSLMRDVLAYELARRSGRYATRYRYCELFINGNYEGIYILMEKVKRDKNRVDVTKLEPKDSTGNALTGGYIVKIDKTTGNNNGGWTDTFPISPGSSGRVYFQYDYPNWDDMVQKQRDYIANAIYKFEVALSSSTFDSPTKGYRQYADENTFIDLSIINEISKNVDGYRLSTYMFKDRDSKGGKLKMGPVWDFNLAFNNADYNNSSDPTGWEIDLSYGCPFWWKRLREDTGYVNSYYCRWNQLRQSTFSLYSIHKFLDSTYAVLEDASYRNFQRWPVLGIYVWPNPSPLSYSMREETDSLKSWITKRVNWMDSELSKNCKSVKKCAPRVNIRAESSTICKYQKVRLSADGLGNSFRWTNAKLSNLGIGREISVVLDTTTTFKVIMQTASGCMDSANITIRVLPLPDKTISGKTSFCEGGSTELTAKPGYKSYFWSPATGLNSTSTFKVKASGTYNINYKLVITDSFGCFDSSYTTVTVNKNPDVKITASRDSVCLNDSLQLTAQGAISYVWLPQTGLSTYTGKTVTVVPQNTQYTVVGTSDQGCKDTASFNVGLFKKVPITIHAVSSEVCFGSGTTLTAIGGSGSGFNWLPAGSFMGSKLAFISVYPQQTTMYKVLGVDKNGCNDSAQKEVKVFPEFTLQLTGDLSICKGQATQLKVIGANTYFWSPSKGLSSTTGDIITAAPEVSTNYSILGFSVNSCVDTMDLFLKVHELPVVKVSASSMEIEKGKTDTLYVSGATKYLWSPANLLNTDTGSMVIATPLVSTLFKVQGIDTNLCSGVDSVYLKVNQPNTVKEGDQNYSIKVTPNPINDKFYIETKEDADIEISTLNGKVFYRAHLNAGTNVIDSESYLKGIYILTMQTPKGSQYFRILK